MTFRFLFNKDIKIIYTLINYILSQNFRYKYPYKIMERMLDENLSVRLTEDKNFLIFRGIGPKTKAIMNIQEVVQKL